MKPIQVISLSEEGRQWGRALCMVACLLLLMFAWQSAFASDGAEFADAVTKWNSWVKGNLGKLAALISIGVGSVMAAVKKDWSWFFGAMVLSIGIGVLVGIVNASFTATL